MLADQAHQEIFHAKVGEAGIKPRLLETIFWYLRPKSTAMVMAGQSVHLTGKLEQAVNQYFVHILLLVTDNNPS